MTPAAYPTVSLVASGVSKVLQGIAVQDKLLSMESDSVSLRTAGGRKGEHQSMAARVIDLDDTSGDETPPMVDESSGEDDYDGGYNSGVDLSDGDSL